MRRHGFTLRELIAVMVILALLMAMLVSGSTESREAYRRKRLYEQSQTTRHRAAQLPRHVW
ncbi:MAG: type II secretion system protein [Pirellulales bacterium]